MQRDANGDIWVFGYGSLMWNPGFPHAEALPAVLRGYHRAFCLYSSYYRGTRERPGLVLGLDRGGVCRGKAFRITAGDAERALHYLIDREMRGEDVYLLRWREVAMVDRRVTAACFVVNRKHKDYAGRLTPDRVAEIVGGATGQTGRNRDYLLNTVQHLHEIGVRDTNLHKVCDLLLTAQPVQPNSV